MKVTANQTRQVTIGGRQSEFKIVIRDENCDNLIKQTIEFLEVVKGLKNESGI